MTAVVHIGFHKTGTTALQRQFFPRLPDTVLLTHGGTAGRERSLFRMLSDNLLAADEGDFLEETMRAFLAETRRRAPRALLISHEGFSGEIFGHGYNRERNAVRLHRVVPDAKILVVVRHQGAMLRSIYTQHIRRGGFSTFSQFALNQAEDCDFDLDHLQFDTLVARYHELFGRDRVLVLAYETLLSEPREFLASVCRLIGSVGGEPPDDELRLGLENRSLSPLSRWVVRHSNRLFRQSAINPKPRVGAIGWAHALPGLLQTKFDPAFFPNAMRRLGRRDAELLGRLLERYEDSNARLERLTGLPLRALGYPLPAESTLSATDEVLPTTRQAGAGY